MTRVENKTKKNNFEIGPDGKIIINGIELKTREGIKPALKKNIEERVNSIPAEKPKKRMRWLKGSFLTDQQVTDEQKQIDDHIA